MAPRAVFCPLCGRGYFSASLPIHLRACAEKAAMSVSRHACPHCACLFATEELARHVRGCACRPLRDDAPPSPARLLGGRPATVGGARDAGARAARSLEAALAYAASLGVSTSTAGARCPCAVCGRSFAPDRIAVHQAACSKAGRSRRAAFDSAAQRLAGVVEGGIGIGSGSGRARLASRGGARRATAPPPPRTAPARGGSTTSDTSAWRVQRDEFKRALRAARAAGGGGGGGGSFDGGAGGSSSREVVAGPRGGGGVGPASSAVDVRLECPHCDRRFAAGAAERHIPACAVARARPAPPPSSRGSARPGLMMGASAMHAGSGVFASSYPLSPERALGPSLGRPFTADAGVGARVSCGVGGVSGGGAWPAACDRDDAHPAGGSPGRHVAGASPRAYRHLPPVSPPARSWERASRAITGVSARPATASAPAFGPGYSAGPASWARPFRDTEFGPPAGGRDSGSGGVWMWPGPGGGSPGRAAASAIAHSNATSTTNPLATSAWMSAPHPTPMRRR